MEGLFQEYGIKDWALTLRGDLDKILTGDKKAVKAAWWVAGDGHKGNEAKDCHRVELLLVDIRKIEHSMLRYLAEKGV